ncbi:MAG: ribonuclease Z [Firmicutes bacterium]|nr:ribonuclease Z [Bacillota bacterium]
MYMYFLGTGAGKPSLKRNVTSIALKLPAPKNEIWLFDCGEGTQHQILASPFGLHKVTNVFISHLHGDHIFGLPGFLGSRSFSTEATSLTIYGPPGIQDFVQISLKISGTYLRYPLEVHEVRPGDVLHLDSWTVKIGLLEHNLSSYGYRVEEPPRPGKLQVDKLAQLKIPPGPLYGRLKNCETVILDDGRTINGSDFVGPSLPGRQIVILGDTRYCQGAVELAQEADVLVHEATFAHALAQSASDYGHSTTVQAARVAQQAQVKQLILTHLSSRYRPQDYGALLAEAAQVFPSTILAEDHLCVEIPRPETRGKRNPY